MTFCYHATVLGSPEMNTYRCALKLLKALKANPTLEPNTNHILNGQIISGLCTSRCVDLMFNQRVFGNVVFELKYDELRYQNKIQPIDGSMSIHSLCENKDAVFNTPDFDAVYSAWHERTHGASLAEDFVIGPIRNFVRCINHVYILEVDWHVADIRLAEVHRLLDTLNIPYTEEFNPYDISLLDIYRNRRSNMK